LSEGAHEVRFVRIGYYAPPSRVRIAAGGKHTSTCVLRLATDVPHDVFGTLGVQASESGARVSVDDAPFIAASALPRGPHRVRVERSGFEPVTRIVDVEGGAERIVRVTLVPTEEYRAEYESRADTMRALAWVFTATGVAVAGATAGVYVWNEQRFVEWQAEENRLAELAGQRVPPTDIDQLFAANDDRLSAIQLADKVTIGLGITAGASLVAGLVCWLAGDDPSRYEGIEAHVDRDGARFALGARF
jgi:hypothetical protein